MLGTPDHDIGNYGGPCYSSHDLTSGRLLAQGPALLPADLPALPSDTKVVRTKTEHLKSEGSP